MNPPDESTPLTPVFISHSEPIPSDSSSDSSSDSRTLMLAIILTSTFFLIELFGGYLAGSLAIMSDAAHLLSDLAGLLINLVAVSVSSIPANKHLSFGFARAEVLGAFVSIMFIWSLTVVLIIVAVERLFNPSMVNGPMMLVLGLLGLLVNIILGGVLGHGHGHGHDHGHDHSHGHGHADLENGHEGHNHSDEHDHDHGHGHNHGAADPAQGNSFSKFNPIRMVTDLVASVKSVLANDDSRSVAVRAAYLHVLGDALQNVGVVVAAILVTVRPSWSFLDPLCTLFFAVIVIMTTTGLAKETIHVLMEGTPPGVKLADVYFYLSKIPGVRRIGDLHVWSISPKNPALSVHLYRATEAASHEILKEAQGLLGEKFGITHATIQVNCDADACCDDQAMFSNSTGEKICVSSDALQETLGAVEM